MAVITQLANSPEQLEEAHELVRKSYGEAFHLDLDELKIEHHEQFKHEVLIATSSTNGEILGTLSFMYPSDDGVFPCESFFGFNLKKNLKKKRQFIEIGRFATSKEGKKNPAVVISLFLGITYFVKARKINGWVATVKDDIFNFFLKINMPMHLINQLPDLPKSSPLWGYIGDVSSLHLFKVSSSEAANSFSRFQGCITKKLIEIKIT